MFDYVEDQKLQLLNKRFQKKKGYKWFNGKYTADLLTCKMNKREAFTLQSKLQLTDTNPEDATMNLRLNCSKNSTKQEGRIRKNWPELSKSCALKICKQIRDKPKKTEVQARKNQKGPTYSFDWLN